MSADTPTVPRKHATTRVPIHDVLAARWSPRAFDASRPVSRARILALMEAARWAPSCYGDEPWRYIVWDRGTDREGWQRAFECLTPGNQSWVKNVPLLMASIASSVFDESGKPNRWAQHDTGAASLNLVLQAVVLGLAAHQMGGFDADKLKQSFGIPVEYTPMAMIAIGYQAPADILSEELQKKELGPRSRKPPETRIFEGTWDSPLAVE